MSNKKILISGTSSGLGKYLGKKFVSIKFNREKKFSLYKQYEWDLIIHCGFYSGDNKKKILEAVNISKKISYLKAKKKIFISSMIIYSKKKTQYKLAKIKSESFFKKKNNYILRLGSLIGPNMRMNTIYKILFLKNAKIGLSSGSTYSFITYHEVFLLVKEILKQNKYKIVDFLRKDFIDLKKISKYFKKDIVFGTYLFKCNNSNKKNFFNKILKNKSSLDVLNNFYAENKFK